jgi:hypothetical protein
MDMMSNSSPRATPGFPTPYPDVNAAVHELLLGAQATLGEHFLGMYLSGSLALGDFDRHSSDIDFVVVTDADPTNDLLAALQGMHARFQVSASPWATEVEAAYIPQHDLRRYDPARARHPHIERGPGQRLDMDQLDSGWVIQRSILREHGVVIAGPDPRTLIDPVPRQDMHWAVKELMDTWWEPMRRDPSRLHSPNNGYQTYAVLTMCRMLYTIDCGAVVSKPAAARWALESQGRQFTALIERALAWRKDGQNEAAGDVSETLELIQYTFEHCRQVAPSPPRVEP